MGGVRNVSSHLHSKAGRSSVRTARVSKKDATNKPARSRVGARAPRTASSPSKKIAAQEPLEITEFPSVWEAIGYSPQEAANLNIRAELLIKIREIIRENKWKQAAAAKRCDVSQPRINDLMRGRVDKFSIDALVNIAGALGWKVELKLEAA
jgi:predicted XRE-type DNA-binding protein